ncbi:MAG: alpha-glucan family phosphorylase [bacterium]|nr:alpha-glucan family phosphorylase [bacterium]
MSDYNKWFHPYKPAKEYSKKVAYFSMEFAIDQPLKTYSGGLGFLAGSHMRSGFEKKQNLIGIGMLWKYGYYDQGRQADQSLDIKFIEKNYNFLEDTGITVSVTIKENENVFVKAYCLKPEIFGTVPMYFLSTDLPENDFISRTITDRLYDANELTRIAQSIVLGIGGAKVVEALGGADVYHLNEGHGLPAFYYLKDKGVKKEQFVFTTHTPEKAGNEERDAQLLNEMGFYGKELTHREILAMTDNTGMLNYTVAALRLSKIANGVSKLHGKVSNDMWKSFKKISKIISITNSQNRTYWQDDAIAKAVKKDDYKALAKRKKELKAKLFEHVANATGKILDPDVLTIVWARRFAGYKRADLLLWDMERFKKLVSDTKRPIQIIWAGKPYPLDGYAVGVFNRLIKETMDLPNCTVVTGYELALSRLLKEGSDIWLNNPRITREASGTSGMTAAMNGSVNVSTDDGWIPEFAKNGKNSFVLPALDHEMPHEEMDDTDAQNLYKILESKVLKLYYDKPEEWGKVVMASTKEVLPYFDSGRMADEYYQLMYNS